MRNVFLFIRRYFTFLTFLALQGVALWFLFNYNRFHRAKGLGWANELTGRVNSQYKTVDDFFHLKAENQRVHRMNDSLLNLLPGNYMKIDTGSTLVSDSIPYDTLGHFHRYVWRDAKVVYNTVNSQKNYIQFNRGSNQGVTDNMGVIGSDGSVVGIVVNVSPNFSQAMSLLHVQNNSISASIKRSGEFGTIEWDGNDPRYVYLKKLPKSVEVKKGDTVLTSKYSYTIPPGYMVGTVEEVRVDNKTGMFQLKLRTSANFYALEQVHIIETLRGDEQRKLNADTKKKIEDVTKSPR